jgi:hypothetical protein
VGDVPVTEIVFLPFVQVIETCFFAGVVFAGVVVAGVVVAGVVVAGVIVVEGFDAGLFGRGEVEPFGVTFADGLTLAFGVTGLCQWPLLRFT